MCSVASSVAAGWGLTCCIRSVLIRNLRWIFPDLRIVVITGNKTMAEKALKWGADSVSRPPGGSWQLRLTVKRALASLK